MAGVYDDEDGLETRLEPRYVFFLSFFFTHLLIYFTNYTHTVTTTTMNILPLQTHTPPHHTQPPRLPVTTTTTTMNSGDDDTKR
jgi:hypothetical protein